MTTRVKKKTPTKLGSPCSSDAVSRSVVLQMAHSSPTIDELCQVNIPQPPSLSRRLSGKKRKISVEIPAAPSTPGNSVSKNSLSSSLPGEEHDSSCDPSHSNDCKSEAPSNKKPRLKGKVRRTQPKAVGAKRKTGSPKDCASEASEDHDLPSTSMTPPCTPQPLTHASCPVSSHCESESAKPGEVPPYGSCDSCPADELVQLTKENTKGADEFNGEGASNSSESINEGHSEILSDDGLDDDDELPEVFGPETTNSEGVQKGDLLWVKTKKYPFWPAMVKNVYWVKKRISKMTVVFIGEMQNKIVGFNNKPKGLTVVYNKNKIIPFGCTGSHGHHEKLKEEGLQSELGMFFQVCVQRVEEYVCKKAIGDTTLSTLEYFKEEMALDELKEVEMTPNLLESVLGPSVDSDLEETPAKSTPLPVQESPKMSAKLTKKIARTREMGSKIVKEISTDRVKRILQRIYAGEHSSKLHTKFMDTSLSQAERNQLRHSGFGPITDDSQTNEIMDILVQYYTDMKCESRKKKPDIDYITTVWVPEAIIYGMAKYHKMSYAKAEDRFVCGPRYTKEEHSRIRREIMANKDNIDEEAKARYDRKIKRSIQNFKSTYRANSDSFL